MRLTRPKNRYQGNIIEYQKRLQTLREKFDYKPRKKMPPEYHKMAYRLQHKIWKWKDAIRTIDRRNAKIESIRDLVYDFTGVCVWRSNKRKDKKSVEAKRLFCTVGLESGICGKYLSDYIGSFNYTDFASRARMEFKRSLKTNIYNRELWQRWKIFIREQKGVSQAA